ncbi:methyltransferase domain-containing protein [Sulfitobacter sp. TSTF-M16]|uniref:Methyltransferase domain-containing protein n=2 Tax=Sulfitobacter aestuariivivens TaxID=2766981 RepID=A0A927D885_9RHOB|nr:methyltransferase domain-containing protein [Sulfitobacter aestuariivivens]MBD3666231.1 methyltransferase domain-containing protein [Sulfitobacter aestuariivivens]
MTFDAFHSAERQGWHDRAGRYDGATALATLQIVPALLDALHLRPGMRLIDLACGPGYVAGAAAALLINAEGIDFAPAMIETAQKRFPDLAFRIGDILDMPHDTASFDAAACNMGLFHVIDPAKAMSEAARVLRPGGRFAFSQWTAPSDSALYAGLFEVMKAEADMALADPAPDAYALSDPETVAAMMTTAGFTDISTRRLETVLIAPTVDFFDFFMSFGVRVPLIVGAQAPDVQDIIRDRMNAAMAPYETDTGYEVPMPSLLFAGTRQ